MKTTVKLFPGQPGTKKLVEMFGDKLLCVRYRYDTERELRIKTVELVVEESAWQPKPSQTDTEEIVSIKVNYDEIHLRSQVKQNGGKWNYHKKLWELPYRNVVQLDLVNRIVK
ncbi:MAG: hypothetical protein HUU32_23385 [Calditrichaceae bacterium]|nr:hypothetical protein [Calditrichia bacterium]NUQ44340.1 hypothetical protein [Calditrichaceae bacterium]